MKAFLLDLLPEVASEIAGLTFSRNVVSFICDRPQPRMKKFSARRSRWDRLKSAGISFLRTRSPDAPNITIPQGSDFFSSQYRSLFLSSGLIFITLSHKRKLLRSIVNIPFFFQRFKYFSCICTKQFAFHNSNFISYESTWNLSG